eukprot:5432059-Amphidinium_carterae.1
MFLNLLGLPPLQEAAPQAYIVQKGEAFLAKCCIRLTMVEADSAQDWQQPSQPVACEHSLCGL